MMDFHYSFEPSWVRVGGARWVIAKISRISQYAVASDSHSAQTEIPIKFDGSYYSEIGAPIKVVHAPINTASLASHNAIYQRSAGVDAKAIVNESFRHTPIQSFEGVEFVDWLVPPAYPWIAPRGLVDRPGSNDVLCQLRYHTMTTYKAARWLARQVLATPRRALVFTRRMLYLHTGRRHIREEFADVDVIHWYSGENRDCPIFSDAATLNAAKFTAWQGCEIRIPEVELQTNPYYRYILDDHGRSPWESTRQSLENQRTFARFGFTPLVTVGMAQYVLPEYHAGMRQIFHPIPIPETPSFPSADTTRLKVVHAPSNPSIKGTKFVRRAAERLSESFDFEYIELTGVPRDQALAEIESCDIFIDQLILGDHGMASLEAMSYGKPTVCYIKESLRTLFPKELPIVNACPDNITSRLYTLLADGELRRELGVRSRKYVEMYHDPVQTTARLLDIYQEAANQSTK